MEYSQSRGTGFEHQRGLPQFVTQAGIWWGILKTSEKSLQIDRNSFQNSKKTRKIHKKSVPNAFQTPRGIKKIVFNDFFDFWMDFGDPRASQNGPKIAKKRKKWFQNDVKNKIVFKDPFLSIFWCFGNPNPLQNGAKMKVFFSFSPYRRFREKYQKT